MNWPHDTEWLIWLAAALASGVIEIATVDFFFLMIGGGALIAAVAAVLGVPVVLQVLIFAASSGGLLYGARPPLKRWANDTPSLPTNAAALVGQEARVLDTVTERTGLVKLAGETWTARIEPGQASLEVGSTVFVVRIDGATAMVVPKPASPAPRTLPGRPTP